MELIDLSPLLGIPAIVKVVDAYRHLALEHDWRKFGFTVGAWVVGFGLVALVSQTSGNPLGDLNWADMVLLGIGVGATASVVHDVATRGEYKPVPLDLGANELDPPDFVEPE